MLEFAYIKCSNHKSKSYLTLLNSLKFFFVLGYLQVDQPVKIRIRDELNDNFIYVIT